jgi:hypothetical protein
MPPPSAFLRDHFERASVAVQNRVLLINTNLQFDSKGAMINTAFDAPNSTRPPRRISPPPKSVTCWPRSGRRSRHSPGLDGPSVPSDVLRCPIFGRMEWLPFELCLTASAHPQTAGPTLVPVL